jgi:hypothetical protein
LTVLAPLGGSQLFTAPSRLAEFSVDVLAIFNDDEQCAPQGSVPPWFACVRFCATPQAHDGFSKPNGPSRRRARSPRAAVAPDFTARLRRGSARQTPARNCAQVLCVGLVKACHGSGGLAGPARLRVGSLRHLRPILLPPPMRRGDPASTSAQRGNGRGDGRGHGRGNGARKRGETTNDANG